MKIAFIGIGQVGFALANNLEKKDYEIVIASDDAESETVKKAIAINPNFQVKKIQDAIDVSEIIFLATPFSVNKNLLEPLEFKGKILVDCTNPVGPGISHGLNSEISGAEKIQEWANSANVVKAFTIYGFENLENTDFSNYNTKPIMLIAGNVAEVKQKLEPLINALGYDMKDTGKLDQSLHLEHMTLLWVKMVRRDGHHPNFVWAYLEK